MKLLGKLVDSLFLSEDFCISCGKGFEADAQGFVCPKCIEDLKPFHPFEYIELPFISGYRIFAKYEGALEEVIKSIKFRRALPLVQALAGKVETHLKEYLKDVEPDMITFVPVHFWRRWGRGFDHNEELLRFMNIPFLKVVERHRYSKPLAGYGREERKRITGEAFRVRKSFIDLLEGKRVLVVDDLLTTGSTAQSVAKILMEVGVDEVYFYFVAREL